MDYLDFDVQIEARGDSYETQVIASPAGEARGPLVLPPIPADGREESEDRRYGAALFAALLGGEVGRLWGRSLALAEGAEMGLRLRLRLPPELQPLPWELLWDPGSGDFLTLAPRTPVVRYLEVAQQPAARLAALPLRLLLVTATPVDQPALDVAREAASVGAALAPLVAAGELQLAAVAGDGTLPQLQVALRGGADVVHLAAHGRWNGTTGQGELFFVDATGLAQPIGALTLARLLRESGVGLVVLNLCQSAQSDTGDAFSGLAGALVRAGVPAVVAMRAAVADEDALTLARTFYEALARGTTVDAALTEARQAVAVAGGRAWATPALFTRVTDARLFPPATTTLPPLPAPRSGRATLLLGLLTLVILGVAALILFGLLRGGSGPQELAVSNIQVRGSQLCFTITNRGSQPAVTSDAQVTVGVDDDPLWAQDRVPIQLQPGQAATFCVLGKEVRTGRTTYEVTLDSGLPGDSPANNRVAQPVLVR